MSRQTRRVLVVSLLLASLFSVGRSVVGRSGLGPPVLEQPCERPIELRGLGVLCGAARVQDMAARPVPLSPNRLALLAVPVDLNYATAEALVSLPGVGAKLAARIIAARPFTRIEELLRVRGIGPKTLRRLRPRLVLESQKAAATGE